MDIALPTTVSAGQIEKMPAVKATPDEYQVSYREDIGCSLKSIEIDFVDHRALVTTVSGHTDMTGCISLVMMLDPDINNIQTVDGNAFLGEHRIKDTQYIKHPDNGWYAVCWDKPSPTKTHPHGTNFVKKRLTQMLSSLLDGLR